MPEGTTRRMYRRVLTDCEGCILTAQRVSRCRARDLSLNGFRVEADIALVLASFVMARIWIPGQTQPIDIDQAVVRWASNNEGVGLQVVALSNGADFQLGRYVERLLAQEPVSGGVSHASGNLWLNGGAGIPVHARAARGQAEA